jgi:hypothetical protein
MVSAQVRRIRPVWLALLVTVPVAAWIGFLLPRVDPPGTTPRTVTLVAVAASLWITFTAERDARRRLEHMRRGFALSGEVAGLLRDHRRVFLIVLLRLELVVALGLATAVWGLGPRIALWFHALALLMILLAWPTERKISLVLLRAREFLEEQ